MDPTTIKEHYARMQVKIDRIIKEHTKRVEAAIIKHTDLGACDAAVREEIKGMEEKLDLFLVDVPAKQ